MKLFRKALSIFLAISILAGLMSVTSYAVVDTSIDVGAKIGTNDYYNVISRKDWNLVPGAASETELVINNSTGTRRQVLHIIEVDPSNPDVSIVPGYNQIDKDLTNSANWSHANLTDMAAYYEKNLGYNIVGGMNTDLYYDTYAPRVLVYNGKNLSVKGETAPTKSILYVFKEEGSVSCEVKAFNRTEFNEFLNSGKLLHAVGVSFGMVVNNGELVQKNEERTSAPAARSMVGIKDDGTLVICMNDGRGANNSVGLCDYEEGEVMLALGCKWAANCDGGGSSTFLTKRAGEESFTMRSVPCDGAQRPTAHGIFVVSNVAPTGELDVVNIESEYKFFAPNTKYKFSAEAIDTHGYAMDMPSDAVWQLSDNSFGTLADGEFVSNGKKGAVDINMVSGGKIVGSKTITVADPVNFSLSATSTIMPYSTPDKIRTITIPIIAMIGEENVYYDKNAIAVSLSNNNAGVLEGYNFTATDNTEISGVDVTVEYISTKETLKYSIAFGKGSEVIYDFEDGDKAGFMGFVDAKQWSINNGVNNTLVGDAPLAGQFNEQISSTTFVSENTVRNGKYALAWSLDNTDADFASWSYNVLFNVGETVVLRDVANGKKATALGMWLYIPEGAAGLAFQSQLYVKNADGSYSCKQDHFMFETVSGVRKNLNSCTEEDIPESRWVYASIDISNYDYLCTPVATDEGNSRSPSFIRTYVKPTSPATLTFYIDDITLDYSSAVDDRVLPTISDITYATADTAIALNNGTKITGDKVAFAARVSDNSILDNSSAKILLDGVEVESNVAGGVLSSADIPLIAGEHIVAFEIKDELGNLARVTRTFSISGDTVISIGGHNESGAKPEYGSVYYVDVNVADINSINKVEVSLLLQNANKWETQGITVAKGFDIEYSLDKVENILTLTIEKNGEEVNEATALVSIPVRLWTWDGIDNVSGTPITPEAQFKTGYCPVVTIDCKVIKGILNDNSYFGGKISVETMLNDNVNPWHYHDAELTVLNKEATATETGYTGRIYCETCKSVVDWGTVVEPKGHNYVIVDGKFVCSDEGCGDIYKLGTGVVEMNGKTYYAIAGNLVQGWQQEDTTWYYLGVDYAAVTGEYTYQGRVYYFNDDGSLKGGQWFKVGDNYRYYEGPIYHYASNGATIIFRDIDGYTYGFDASGYRVSGYFLGRTAYGADTVLYKFDENGHQEKIDITGLFDLNGETYYLVNNVATYAGLIEIDGDLYYIRSTFQPAVGEYWVYKTNGLVSEGMYNFGADGKMIKELKNGIVDGYYYIDDVIQEGAGLIELDGEYYYVRTSGAVATGYYYVNKPNGLLEAGFYTFGEDGKMIRETAKNGVVDGFYYIDGVIQEGAGLIELDGEYYYVRTSGAVATGYYYVNKPNGLLEAGFYTFGEDGKMIRETAKNGVIDGYYYIDGVIQEGAGLIELDGEYYYVRTSGAVATGYYYVNKPNGLLEAGFYTFGEDGKMIRETAKNGVIDGYYYIDGVIQEGAGLIEIDGEYYYVRTSGAVATGYYYVNKPNGLLEAGFYTFDEDGKMIRETVKNGVIDGYYYIDGVMQVGTGLIEIDGDYYYVRSNGAVATGEYWVYRTNDLVSEGMYTFDSDGKMIR